VIAVFVERLEMEILAFPEHVTIEAVEDVTGEARGRRPDVVEIEPA
jgi:hypothetical protein